MAIEPETLMGDVNADGEFNAADVAHLQKWLLAVPDTELKNRKAADCNSGSKLNAVDLTLMKQLLLKQ
ncbi:MAG: dockerin type I repeat-containing protein [Oscillospiraceae bacterium]|nr:dockerin type I repeat-containing protein [Oscillospiraceae bacterium]